MLINNLKLTVIKLESKNIIFAECFFPSTLESKNSKLQFNKMKI